jgi:SAM-dependent methyltransferase
MTDELALLMDLHRDAERQGPGSDEVTLRALDLTGVDRAAPLDVLDMGCGTGASSLVLAQALPHARITAVDFLQPFLDELSRRASEVGAAGPSGTVSVASRITPLCASMDELPLPDGGFDLVWSEGAVYSIGFGAGTRAWRRLLRPRGVLAISEITWLTATRPSPIQAHWDAAYPEINLGSAKMRVLEDNGYSPLGYFALPSSAWLNHYYRPLQARFEAFLARQGHSAPARAMVDAERHEIALYELYREHVGYGFYVAQRVDNDVWLS